MQSDVQLLGTQVNLLWVVLGAAMVVFMQAGFALVETGFTRAKHAAHVVSTNFAIFGLGFIGFFLIGFPLAFGGFSYSAFGMDNAVGEALLGSGNWIFLFKGGWAMSGDGITPAVLGFFLYMVAFMDTVATIPTGSMAERWKWSSFTIWGVFCGAIYYPLFAAWTWGGGWLAKTWDTMSLGAGYVDFAGSGVVHAVGGVAALAGAIVLGPRIGKFGADGKPRAIPGHHIPMAMLGTFILLFGWFGFNAGSALAANGLASQALVNTHLAAASAMLSWLLVEKLRAGHATTLGAASGAVAGLVAITPCAGFVGGMAPIIIGLTAGAVCYLALALKNAFKFDDSLDVIAVHLVGGILGAILLGFFADTKVNSLGFDGVFFGGGSKLLVNQFIAIGATFAFSFIVTYVVARIIDATIGLRVSAEDELVGLDQSQHAEAAYQ